MLKNTDSIERIIARKPPKINEIDSAEKLEDVKVELEDRFGRVTDDIEYLFRKNFSTIDLVTTYNLYQRKYPYSEDERLLLFVKLSIPDKINIYPSSLETNKSLLMFYDRLITFNRFILDEKQEKKNSK